MNDIKKSHSALDFFNKIQYNVTEKEAQNLDVKAYKNFDFLPDFALFQASYIVKKSFDRPTENPQYFDNSICFYFKNLVHKKVQKTTKSEVFTQKPTVNIFPNDSKRISHFKKNEEVQVVAIMIHTDYLKSFLGNDAEQFSFLFEQNQNYLMEEILSDDLLQSVQEIMAENETITLPHFFYKLKALDLLYALFRQLGKRSQTPFQKLDNQEIAAIYKVREHILKDLSHPSTIDELKKIAGMNQLKMRKIFTQIFGMGMYDYYQHYRMLEAARLLREDHLTVAEAGYQMGFENLSHFSRVFEKHIGQKPKKFMQAMAVK